MVIQVIHLASDKVIKKGISFFLLPSLIGSKIWRNFRFICDLSSFSAFDSLRSQMISVCQWLLTERFMDCAQIGRDLVLALMRVSKIPQFATIWKQLLYSPNRLGPNISGIFSCAQCSCSLVKSALLMFNCN